MRKYLLAAAAVVAFSGAALADQTLDEVEACMQSGVTSRACQSYRRMDQMENQMRALEEQERQQQRGDMNCALYGRC
jgi:hypothetical protein